MSLLVVGLARDSNNERQCRKLSWSCDWSMCEYESHDRLMDLYGLHPIASSPVNLISHEASSCFSSLLSWSDLKRFTRV